MITAFVGTYSDDSDTPISGNGKTCSMTGFAYIDYLAGKRIWSNYYTTFSEEVIGCQAMIEKIGNTPNPNLILCITEMQTVLNSIGSTNEQILFIDSFASQLRKLDVDIYWDTQRFLNIQKRLRIHTDIIMIPIKFHMNNAQCNFNRCQKPHKIYVYSLKPPKRKARIIFDATEVGKLYNTKDIVIDKLKIKKGK